MLFFLTAIRVLNRELKLKRTHKKAGVPVGEGFIGRIVNSLGEPIDGKGEIKAEGYRPVEATCSFYC